MTIKMVLLVDDEPDNVEVILDALEFRGIEAKSATNGQQALDMLKDFTPDLILLDLSMPVMDGWETRQRLEDDPKTQPIPVVALTAHAMMGDRERVLEAGFDGYVSKPISVATFVDDIRSTLKKNARPS
ncbi:MAG: response regulator [Anaerolineae bacterium]|nr:response regulator [Anaerolineae bacterium]